MSERLKGFAEVSKKVDLLTIGVAFVGAQIGLVPIGFAMAAIDFSLLTYFGAEAITSSSKR